MMKKNLSNTNTHESVAVLAHVLTTVPVVDLEEYLQHIRVPRLLFIHHPLFVSEAGSSVKKLLNAQVVLEKSASSWRLPSILLYLKDTVLSLFWLLRHGPYWDVIIALDNLNASAALLLRKLGYVKKVVYYAIDYVPERFSQPLLNELYHKIDDYCAMNADSVWNVSARIGEARQEIRGVAVGKNQHTVPIGIWLERFPVKPFEEIDPYHLVYAGGLLPHQGVQDFLHALPTLKKDFPKIHFSIIGLGVYEEELQELVRTLHLEKVVTFHGYFPTHDEVAEFCAKCGLAIALYNKDLDQWSRFADPSKMKTYLAAGLPIITTDVTHFAQILEQKKCGVITTSQSSDIASAVSQILESPQRHKKMRENARTLAAEYQWNEIFQKALNTL